MKETRLGGTARELIRPLITLAHRHLVEKERKSFLSHSQLNWPAQRAGAHGVKASVFMVVE